MAPQWTVPGVFVKALWSSPTPIERASTAVTAFIGATERGPVETPRSIRSLGDFERVFGDLGDWPMAQAIRLFFVNGGAHAVVVRVVNNAEAAEVSLPAGSGRLKLAAATPGAWGNRLHARVGHAQTTDHLSFNLRIELRNSDGSTELAEVHADASIDPDSPRFLTDILAARSELVRFVDDGNGPPVSRPDASQTDDGGALTSISFSAGRDGDAIGDAQISGPGLAARNGGLWALDVADTVNLLCIPPFTSTRDVGTATWATALDYCRRNRIFLLVDPPKDWLTAEDVVRGLATLNVQDANAAMYWPRLRVPALESGGRFDVVAPGGAIAGVYCRTDNARGVWKSPAGVRAQIQGAVGLTTDVSDQAQEVLSDSNVNALRTFDRLGLVVWGVRTLAPDTSADRYVPVRRTALLIETSLRDGLRWTAFKRNEPDLWSSVRLLVNEFMYALFLSGAFAGYTAREGYFVRCGYDTHTAQDQSQGRLNVHVGFASLRPAEFQILVIELPVQGR